MSLRLPRRLNPFNRPSPRELSSREALEIAEASRRRWSESAFSHLCCVYAGAMEGEDPAIGPLDRGGRSRLWHFDYFSREAERFLRVQVFDGQARYEETRVRAGGLGYPQMNFRFASYGYREDRGREEAPLELPESLADSSIMVQALRHAWGDARVSSVELHRGLLALLIPGSYANGVDGPGESGEVQIRGPLEAEREAWLIVADAPASKGPQAVRFDLATGRLLEAPSRASRKHGAT